MAKKNSVEEVWGDGGVYDEDPPVAYCMKCQDQQFIKKPQLVRLKNGKVAITGTCPECKSKLFKILGKDDVIPENLRNSVQQNQPQVSEEQLNVMAQPKHGYMNQEEVPENIVIP
jgi:hypothetical protein